MRQGGPNNGRRPRGRHHGGGSNGGGHSGGGGNGPSAPMRENRPRSAASLRQQSFDSNGPDVRVRGNAWQVFEKYQQLARDATSSGDPVLAESLLQHAEHYYRIIEAINEATAAEQRQQGGHGGGGGRPQPPFGQQPEVPANYYAPENQPLAAQPAGAPATSEAPAAQAPQAEVERRPAPTFFPPTDDMDDNSNGPEPLVARG